MGRSHRTHQQTSALNHNVNESRSTSDASAPSALVTLDVESRFSQVTTRYHLYRHRTPCFRCGTCGLRDCTCVQMIAPTITTRPRESWSRNRENTLSGSPNCGESRKHIHNTRTPNHVPSRTSYV